MDRRLVERHARWLSCRDGSTLLCGFSHREVRLFVRERLLFQGERALHVAVFALGTPEAGLQLGHHPRIRRVPRRLLVRRRQTSLREP